MEWSACVVRTSVGRISWLFLIVCGVVLVPGTSEGRLVTGFAPCPQTNPPAAECIVSLLVDLRPFRLKGSKAATLPQAPSTSVSTTYSPPTTSLPVPTSTRPSPSVTDEELQLQLLHQQRRYEMQLREQQRHQQVLERQLRQQGEDLRFLQEQVRQLLQLLGTKAALDVPQRADEINWDRSRS